MKLRIAISLFFLLPHIIFAAGESCPTPFQIQSSRFSGFSVYDIDSGLVLNANRLAQFQSNVQQFALAEWLPEAPEGEAHCYYVGSDPSDVSYLNAYLAKPGLFLNTTFPWKSEGGGAFRCNKSLAECWFTLGTN